MLSIAHLYYIPILVIYFESLKSSVNGYLYTHFLILTTQDDVVLGTLSVRENLQFSAALRLPSHLSRKERKERVEKVIDELGLKACANTKVD